MMKFQKWVNNHWETFNDTLENVTTELSINEFEETKSKFIQILSICYQNKFLCGLFSKDREEINKIILDGKKILRYNFNPTTIYIV